MLLPDTLITRADYAHWAEARAASNTEFLNNFNIKQGGSVTYVKKDGHILAQNQADLNGGGATSMYIAGQTSSGIVNFPSDNRTFDHYSQRKVANVIVVY